MSMRTRIGLPKAAGRPALFLGLAAAALAITHPEAAVAQNAPGSEPETVEQVNLERYMGLWYEFARLPNDFQSQCVGNVTAEYTLRDDGKVDVVNRCETEDGSIDEAEGVARIVDEETNARLEVSFVQFLGFSFFWGDYWILGLGEDYEWAVVGHPEREYGWLLVRDPDVGEEVADEMYFILESRGYRHDEFVITPQDGAASAND